MKKILFLALLLSGFIGISQTTVNGKVVDQNNEPIPGANVVIVGKAIGTTADFDGLFNLETSEVPPFQLKITSVGYSEATENVTENNQTFTVVLNEAQTFLDEVVISASRTPERIFESPVSVERFGLKEIKNTSSASFYSGLENLKGVDINKASLTFQSLNTRGFATFANTRFLQLIDGMDNSAPGLNFVLGNLVGMNELEVQSVEILPGASSALYGAGAFNGLLYMNSKNPFDFQGISTYLRGGVTSQEAAGSNQYYDIGIRAAHAFSDKFAVKANFSILKGEDWHAVDRGDFDNPTFTRADPSYDGLNVYGDEVGIVLNFDTPLNLAPGTLGSAFVSRTGYDESDLTTYDAESVKFDGSIHYRPFANDFEIVYNGRVGRGNTIYPGANRYAITNFIMQQHKLEFRNDNFFLRGYITTENSGDSYDTRFAAINVNRAWKGDVQWFTEYTGAYIGSRLGNTALPGITTRLDDTAAHAYARQAADSGRLVPGTPGFESAFNQVISDGDLATGAKFIDNTKLRHVDANYNFTHLTKDIAEIQVGGSFREYVLNSGGTIFTDFDKPITYGEYGAYLQVQKKLVDDRLKLTGSVRYDKNEFFDGFFSPRLSAVFTAGEKRNQNFRASIQRGFRNPTTQDLFIGLDAGAAILVGSAPNNLDRDVRTFDISAEGQALTGLQTSTIVGRAAYEGGYSLSSVLAGAPTAADVPIVKPEEITAYELGYRAQFGKVAIDLSAYYNAYTDFLSIQRVLVPLYGEVGDGGLSLLALQNGDRKVYQAYTNSPADIGAYGGTLGIDAKIFGNFDIGANYTYAEIDFNQAAFPDFQTQFNTPRHKVKASFGNTELFKNFGFNVNYRWSDDYEWQSTFQNGPIPSFSVLDAQLNYSVPSIKSVFKLGGSNLLGEEYFTAVGTGLIGSMYYLSWTINN
ncbi:TonB-dependent receptor [Maribacter algarum]|uniref:TonB-dependent receptor n=1 Tax=Maribacter algarum (ex Zhang et al. 2020) TaxID=2578118 RepID=A0A5S3PW81_9FLAO|nr:TonB-dependent receptor [Maribacter algarum]TMM59276.1 TonB-dependent receptor [Maribacter algarum]